MELQRLNMDSSWWMNVGGISFILDPWLIGSEIDVAKWMNEQWHTTEPCSIENIPPYSFVLVSQYYSDHCHPNTLKALNDKIKIVATAGAFKRIKKELPNKEVILIPDDETININGVFISSLRPNRKMDPIYYSLIISKNEETLFYSPHGFTLTEPQKKKVLEYNYDLLITTFSDFRIPRIMGGHVNPGIENVEYLNQLLQPNKILNTHDEQKRGRGIVMKLAKVVFPDYVSLQKRRDMDFIHTPDYQIVKI